MQGKKTFLLSVLLIVLSISCSDSTSPDTIEYDTTLGEIYLKKSNEEFNEYLNWWGIGSVPIGSDERQLLPDAERHIYDIYSDFYNPFNLNRYAKDGPYYPETGNDYYSSLQNVVVQNEIKWMINDDYDNSETLEDFRPDIFFEGKRLIYFNGYQKEDIEYFLDENLHQDDIWERYLFINEKLHVDHGHWFGWHYVTQPAIEFVNFNTTMDTAAISFRLRYEFGETIYVRSGNEWQMISSKLTGIE